MDTKYIKQKIQESEIISFDMFDTLIVRTYSKPVDLFSHLEYSENAVGYKKARIDAEALARQKATQKNINEVTLDDIYIELHQSYSHLKDKEIELEKLICRANPEMIDIYLFAKKLNKKVIISSDMYLPKEVICDILNINGYTDYDFLFLSSETRRPKATGEMYDDIIETFGVESDKVFHIGDNRYTDFDIPKRKGISAFCYEPISRNFGDNLNSSYFSILNRYIEKDCSVSVLKGLITLHSANNPNENYWKEFGYKYIGFVSYSYINWIKKRLEHLGIKKVYFMLRDGYIMKKVFDELFYNFDTYEIYGSRRLFLFAGMTSYSDIESLLPDLYSKGITYSELWDWLGLKGDALKNNFISYFPNQNDIISSDYEFDKINDFMKQNEHLLLELGALERKNIVSYFDEIGVFEEKSAIVDLGWKGSMLKGIDKMCKIMNVGSDITGFYLGTHDCKTPNLRMESYLLDHGVTTGACNSDILKDYSYIVPVLELAFSAPYNSILSIEKRENLFVPIYQNGNIYEESRKKISELILDGVIEFVKDFSHIDSYMRLPLSKDATISPLEYISKFINKFDEDAISKAFCCYGRGNNSSYRPILKSGKPIIGIINPWPGSESAELEVVTRIKRAADDNDIGYVILDNTGHILDDKQNMTSMIVDESMLLFVITTHYETPKLLNSFYYHTLWNPPEIPMNLDYYTERVTNNYIMNDDFLIYDSGGMSNHLRSMLINCPRTLDGVSSLTASFPKSSLFEPNLDNPSMFYCGMNWEKVVHGTNRHEGLFKLLDNTGRVKFFGPEQVEAWGGLRPWDGYKCYQHSIPFDGFSILNEINKCGICLVLSSDIHRRAGAVTNRLYEACAAGAVIISDDNPFMLEHFKDAALFVVYNKNNPNDTCNQIMEKYNWIISHKEEAIMLAKRAQQIYKDKFTLDSQLKSIIENHPNRKKQIANDIYMMDQNEKVLVTYILNTLDITTAKKFLQQVFSNVTGQIYRNIELAIGIDNNIYLAIKSYCNDNCACANLFAMNLYDSKGVRKMTDGQAIRSIQTMVNHDYYINTNEDEIWFFDHITTLIKSMKKYNSICSYSGSIFEDCNNYRHVNFFDCLDNSYLFNMNKPERQLCSGQFMFSSQAHKLLPDYLFDCLDGNEHYAYANMIYYKFKKDISFTRRMTLCFKENNISMRFSVVSYEMQKRFIQDLVKFDICNKVFCDDYSNNSTEKQSFTNKKAVTDLLLMLPFKTMIKLRYYRFVMRKIDPKSKKYKKFSDKYNSALQRYNEYWGN